MKIWKEDGKQIADSRRQIGEEDFLYQFSDGFEMVKTKIIVNFRYFGQPRPSTELLQFFQLFLGFHLTFFVLLFNIGCALKKCI